MKPSYSDTQIYANIENNLATKEVPSLWIAMQFNRVKSKMEGALAFVVCDNQSPLVASGSFVIEQQMTCLLKLRIVKSGR